MGEVFRGAEVVKFHWEPESLLAVFLSWRKKTAPPVSASLPPVRGPAGPVPIKFLPHSRPFPIVAPFTLDHVQEVRTWCGLGPPLTKVVGGAEEGESKDPLSPPPLPSLLPKVFYSTLLSLTTNNTSLSFPFLIPSRVLVLPPLFSLSLPPLFLLLPFPILSPFPGSTSHILALWLKGISSLSKRRAMHSLPSVY